MILAHLDLDAFFAAVEELEDPGLRAKPLVVGGDPHGRGVVATANYEARRFGIHSAMSCAEALRRCPHAVFVRPNKRLYSEHSRAVWSVVRQVVPTVERTGMDEGYLDIGEVVPGWPRARRIAEAVQTAVRGATRLSCSIGVGTCKVVRLLRERARGIDPRTLETVYESISIGHEETFARDIADREQLHAELRRMALSVGVHLKESGQVARTITTKLRYPDFSIRSRSTTLPAGCADGARIGDLACGLLDRGLAERPGALRLIGVSVSNLEDFEQLALEG